ncbi:MAG: MaoC family dehydratase [Pseudomonadota bacterium]
MTKTDEKPAKKAAPKAYSTTTMHEFIGKEFGPSQPMLVNQIRINTFADCTEDHQWIHVHQEMAKKHSPFGGTVAHGFLVLSMLAGSISDVGIIPKDAKGVLNYGTEKVRFLMPVLVNSEVVNSYKLIGVEEKGKDRLLARVEATTTVKGMPKPAVVAEILAMIVC